MSLQHKLLRASSSKCRTVDRYDIFGDGSGRALYRLDGNANDESGAYPGTEALVTYGGGVYERGAVFNGTSSWINAGGVIPTTGAYTISCWVKCNDVTKNASTFMYFGDGTNTSYSFHLSFQVSKIVFFSAAAGVARDILVSPVNGVWYHVVVIYDGTNLSAYVDNTQTLAPIGTSLTRSGGSWRTQIGWSYFTAYHTGSIDQIRIFNRVVTAPEVATLYTECAPTSTVDNVNPFEDGSLKALYQFDNSLDDATGVYSTLFTGATTYTTGKFGQAGVVAGVASGSAGVPFPASTGECAISYWTNNQGARDRAFGFYQDGSHFLGVYTGGASFFPGNTAPISLGYTITNNSTLKHFVWSFKAGQCKFYENGILKTTLTMAAGFTTLNSFTDSSSTATMLADQVRIFNKALTPMEVASLYNETTPMEEPMHSLVDPFKDSSGKALYRLDGNVLDESGVSNGTATSITYGTSAIGREAIFNGSASVSAAVSLIANTFSYSVWATVTTISSTIQSLIDFSTGRAMLSSGNGTNAYLSYYDGSTYRTFGTYALSSATKTHIGLAINGTSVELFINGVSQGTSACNSVVPSGNLYLGRYAGSASGYLTGREDQVRIFSRVLTATEFQQLYSQGA